MNKPFNFKKLAALSLTLLMFATATSAETEPTQEDYIEKYCMKFDQTPKELVGSLIKEFEQSPFPADEYFFHNKCQSENYSRAVKSPMIHSIADAPESRADFLHSIWLYYSRKRKEPQIFPKILNMPNTKGETLLDYIETLRVKGKNSHPGLLLPIKNLILYTCLRGGVYSVHKDKSCP
ncbi:hypothetical protein [Ottowia thiooxydans]|uniref:hypothetical protein n=1 Tax=Ottowia thiooxydans TaxID=219182 RepID=UPI0012EB3FBB|nr:hypothetical protein [Ottowia thiooxydans]